MMTSTVVVMSTLIYATFVIVTFFIVSSQVQGQELCDNNWLKSDVDLLLHDMRGHIYGQDIAIEQVAAHIRRHITDPHPQKALVLSFNGPTGVGKTYMSTIIANNLYVNGLKSNFVLRISPLLSYTDSAKIPEYQLDLVEKVTVTLKACERSLIILEEFDDGNEVVQKLSESLKPFMDHGSGSPRAIFLILSNIGGKNITDAAVKQHFKSSRSVLNALWDFWRFLGIIFAFGEPEKVESLLEFNNLKTMIAAETEKKIGCHMLLKNQLITEFVPFLPMSQENVKKCIGDAVIKLNKGNKYLDRKHEVLQDLEWIPDERTPIFSRSGCKKVDEKVKFVMGAFDGKSDL